MAETTDNADKIMTVEEVADWLQLSPNTIYNLCSDKKIPHRKIGGSLRFVKGRLILWLSEQDAVETGKEVNENGPTANRRKMACSNMIQGRSRPGTEVPPFDWKAEK